MAAKTAINLLPQELREPGRIQGLRSLLTKSSTVLLSVYLIALLGIVGTLFIFSRQLNSVVSQNEALSSQIDALRAREGLLLSIKNRTRVAKSVFAQTISAELIIDKLIGILPPGVEIMEIASDGSSLVVSLRAGNSQALTNLIQTLKRADFGKVVMSALNQTNTGDYIFSLEVN